MQVTLRRARPAEGPQIARVFEASRRDALPYLPVLHSEEEDERHFSGLVATAEVWVAEVDGELAGMMVLDGDMVEHLYLAPSRQRMGIGSRLLDIAKRSSTSGLRLYTFQRNQAARTFYEKRGFVAVEFGDGSGNEENEPDVLYQWNDPPPGLPPLRGGRKERP